MIYTLDKLIKDLQEIQANEKKDVPIVIEGVKHGRFSNRISDLKVRPVYSGNPKLGLSFVAIVDANKGWADWCLEAGEDEEDD